MSHLTKVFLDGTTSTIDGILTKDYLVYTKNCKDDPAYYKNCKEIYFNDVLKWQLGGLKLPDTPLSMLKQCLIAIEAGQHQDNINEFTQTFGISFVDKIRKVILETEL